MRAICYGLMRTVGMAFFLVVGFGSLYAGNELFDLELDLSSLLLSGGDRKALSLAIGSLWTHRPEIDPPNAQKLTHPGVSSVSFNCL